MRVYDINPTPIQMGQLWFLTDGANNPVGVTVLDAEKHNNDTIVTVLYDSEFLQLHVYAPTVDQKGYWCGLLTYAPTKLPFDRHNMQFRLDDSYDSRTEIV